MNYAVPMCFFITAAFKPLPGEDVNRLAAARPPLALSAVRNPAVESRLAPGEHYFRATGAWCDCDTLVGSASRRGERAESLARKLERDVAKHRKQGWSEQKIRRWLDEKRLAAETRNRAAHGRNEGRADELRSLVSFIHDVAGSRENGLTLLLHMYSGTLDEEFPIEEQTVPASDVDEDWLQNVREDVLYRVTGRAVTRPRATTSG